LGAAGLEFDFQTEAGVAEAALPALARQHLYLIYKEALHNAVKHARGASTVCVRLTLNGPTLCLTVRDDGAGSAAPGRPAGSGLANMRQRAEAVGGTVAYDTAPGQGFAVRVALPLAGQRLQHPAGPAEPAGRTA
jgi:signal transduction histidine kinase